MYDKIFHIMSLLAILFQGWCLQYFYGKFMKVRSWRKNVHSFFVDLRPMENYIVAAIWVLTKLCLNQWLQIDLLSDLKSGKLLYSSLQMVGKTGILFGGLWLIAIVLYQAGNALKVYLSVTFLAVTEISFFLSYMIIVVGNFLFDFWEWCLEMNWIVSIEAFQQTLNITVVVLQLFMYLVFSLLVFFFLNLLIRCYREKDYPIQKGELMFILAPSLVGLLLCILLRMIVITIENETPTLLYNKYPLLSVLIPVILLLSLLSMVYGIRLLQNMISLNREKSGRLILQQQVRSMQEHFQEMDRLYTGIRSMKHDMKNQLSVVSQLAKQKDTVVLQEHLMEMNQRMEALDCPFQTGNAVADTILNMKYYEAIARIPDLRLLTEELLFPEAFCIQSYDLAVILCNAIDNALEACARMEKKEEKFIRLRSFQKGKFFFLEIENCFDGQLIYTEQSEFPESRKDSEKEHRIHGIGLYNIRTAVWKYQGAVDWEVEGKVFLLSVMMKNEVPQKDL